MRNIFVLITLILVLVGCATEDGDSSDNQVVGTWVKSTCDMAGLSYTTETDTYTSGGQHTYKAIVYIDSNLNPAPDCNSPVRIHIQNYNYTLGATVSASGKQATEINIAVLSMDETLYTQAEVDHYNNTTRWDFTDWEIGVTKTSDLSPENIIFYEIIWVDETLTPNELYMGDSASGDGSTAALRPTALDLTNGTPRQ